MPEDKRSSSPLVVEVLASGDIRLEARISWSSNATFLARVEHDGTELHAIYKPLAGEQTLYDFPPGLYRREVAAYELDHWLGWGLIPETVIRSDAPLGEGSLQRWIDEDLEQSYFTVTDQESYAQVLRAISLFDIVVNNTDRKGGHCIVDSSDRLWAIDHGLCFHEVPKLRTVIWDFAGEEINTALLAPIATLAKGTIPEQLDSLLDGPELDALVERSKQIMNKPVYPYPSSPRSYPWPLY